MMISYFLMPNKARGLSNRFQLDDVIFNFVGTCTVWSLAITTEVLN